MLSETPFWTNKQLASNIHAESYVSDVVRAYQTKSFEEFKKCYHSLDILLIDDIQFFAGKSRTQEEFFYALRQIAAKKQTLSPATLPHRIRWYR